MEKKLFILSKLAKVISSFSQKTKLPTGMLVLFALLFLVPVFMDDQYLLRLLISSLLFGCLAMGFDFCAGFINIVNVGFAAFMGMGAYTTGILVERIGVSPWAGIFPAVIIAGICGFLTGILTLRLRGIFAAIMTWFLGLTLYSTTANMVDLTRGQLGLSVSPLFDTPSVIPYYYVVLVIVVLVYIICQLILKSHIGLAFAAIGQDLESAEASGVNPTKYKVINFTISCMIAGLLGWFYAHFINILTPEMMHTKVSVEILALAYLGGRGSLWGGLVAALIFIPVFDYMNSLLEIKLIIYGLLLIAVMIFCPGGLASIFYRAKATLIGLFKTSESKESKCNEI
jgi:branched-chain amino acid transport system permease protein